jgi:hypothetical protein
MQFKVHSLKLKMPGSHDLLIRKIRTGMAGVLLGAITGLPEISERHLGTRGEWQLTSIQIQTHKAVSHR